MKPSRPRRAVAATVSLLLSCTALAACGGDEPAEEQPPAPEPPASIAAIEVEPGPFATEEEFRTAANEFCASANEVFARIPVFASWPSGLVKEFDARIDYEEEYLAKLEEFEAPKQAAKAWDDYIAADEDLIAAWKDVVDAARDDDLDGANEILNGVAADAIDAQEEAASELGLTECFDEDFTRTDPELAAPADPAPAAPEPENTIEEAATAYDQRAESGDCAAIAEGVHSQLYAEEADDCAADVTFGKSAELGEAVSYGPVGAVTFEYEDQTPGYAVFVLDPADGELRYTSTSYASGGGLQPANEGIDADAVIADAVDAIRANDPAELNATLKTDVPSGTDGQTFAQDGPFSKLGTDPEYAKRIVSDIRDDPGAAPELLGVDQVNAYYLLDTEETDYLLIAAHEPGSPTEYRFSAYWALTK